MEGNQIANTCSVVLDGKTDSDAKNDVFQGADINITIYQIKVKYSDIHD